MKSCSNLWSFVGFASRRLGRDGSCEGRTIMYMSCQPDDTVLLKPWSTTTSCVVLPIVASAISASMKSSHILESNYQSAVWINHKEWLKDLVRPKSFMNYEQSHSHFSRYHEELIFALYLLTCEAQCRDADLPFEGLVYEACKLPIH